MQVEKLALELADREAIREVLMRYSRGIDRADVDTLRSAYWEDATDDHGNFFGGVEAFIDFAMPILAQIDQTMHMLGNIHIEVHGDVAASETYFHAYHRMRREDGHRYDAILGGRYVDQMEKRGGEWRIARRVTIYDWYREYEDSADWTSNPFRVPIQSNKAPSDPSYAIFQDARARGGA